MRIEFASVTVCTGVGTDSPEGFDYEGAEDEQVSKFMRAVSAVVRQRFNETTRISFSLFKPMGTILLAEKFVLNVRQPSYLPKYGLLVLKTNDGSGAGQTALYLPNAHLPRTKATYKGSNVTVQFSFSGGAMQTSKP